ncbi:hypothetical protein [Moorena sp. SIO3H5]|uniref:hypothetical protein n=1 Tax=Moorena sp. SIO3H5 TaxID=2607834 RepID=UPI0013BDB8BF|nr:hypothetical protein [Moorena sp. SIO3H5]NEO68226.1 hypothetical protein [Moorena sp. SIO3H5]
MKKTTIKLNPTGGFSVKVSSGMGKLFTITYSGFQFGEVQIIGFLGNREQGAGSREQGAGSREQGIGSREQGTGSREQGAGKREV